MPLSSADGTRSPASAGLRCPRSKSTLVSASVPPPRSKSRPGSSKRTSSPASFTPGSASATATAGAALSPWESGTSVSSSEKSTALSATSAPVAVAPSSGVKSRLKSTGSSALDVLVRSSGDVISKPRSKSTALFAPPASSVPVTSKISSCSRFSPTCVCENELTLSSPPGALNSSDPGASSAHRTDALATNGWSCPTDSRSAVAATAKAGTLPACCRTSSNLRRYSGRSGYFSTARRTSRSAWSKCSYAR